MITGKRIGIGLGTAALVASSLLPLNAWASTKPPRTNHAITVSAVHHLWGDRRLPKDSTPFHGRPPGTLRNTEPTFRSLIEKTGYFHSALDFADARHWLKNHHPGGGLHREFVESGGSSGGTTSFGIAWGSRSTDAYIAPELEVEIARPRHGDGTIWRVQASAEFLDRQPRKDVGGPRLRLTSNGACKGSVDNVLTVRNPGRMPARHLAPPTAPVSARICYYQGALDKHPDHLASVAKLGAGQAQRLADDAHAISLAHLDGAPPTPCPISTTGPAVIDLVYAHRPDIDLWYSGTFCGAPEFRNGHVVSGDAQDHGPLDRLIAKFTRDSSS